MPEVAKFEHVLEFLLHYPQTFWSEVSRSSEHWRSFHLDMVGHCLFTGVSIEIGRNNL